MNILDEIQKNLTCFMDVSYDIVEYTKEHAESENPIKFSEAQIKSEFPVIIKIVSECFDLLRDFCEKNNLEFAPSYISPLQIAWSYDLPRAEDGLNVSHKNLIRLFKYCQKKDGTIKDTFLDLDAVKYVCVHEMLHMLFTNITSKTEDGKTVILTATTGVRDTIDYQNVKEQDKTKVDYDEFYTDVLTHCILKTPMKRYSLEQMEASKMVIFNRLKKHILPS